MNILLSNSTDIFAGGEDYVFTLARHLAKRGHHIWVSSHPGHLLLRKCEAVGVDTVPIAYTGMSRVFGVAGELRRELRRRSIQIIHSNANYDRTCAAIAAAFSPVRHIATVHSAHSIQHNLTHYLRNRFGTAHFIAVAEAVRTVLVEEDNIDVSRITVIPPGVENDEEDFIARAREKTRAELEVAPGTIVIGNVARLVPFKGHKYLLQAIAELVRARNNVLFPILGDGELMDDLKEQATGLGIDKYVRFMGFRDNLNEFYPAFDIYCHSSIELAEEASPIAILRALATRLPVVSTKVGGIGMMVIDGVSGFLTKPEDPRAFAEALLRVMNNKDLRLSMGKASFHLFLKKFQASAMAEQVEHIYAQVIKAQTPH
ncbi:MAG: glycosyltransferase family 4 protein [Bacteroidota bacterium]|mgnify:CR=1 FL=1